MQNYFNYFTEIEERFQQRRGSLLILSTLDWALIETWREAGIPLEAVLRGVDNAFDKQPTPYGANGGSSGVPGLFGGFVPGDDAIGRYYTLGVRLRM